MTDREIAIFAAKQFNSDEITYIEPYGSGHINSTWLAIHKSADGKEVKNLMQKINNYVFKNPDELMENIAGVTAFLRDKVEEDGTLTVIPTLDGKNYYLDEFGNYWRVYKFIEKATAYQQIENDNDFYTCGIAFGEFQQMLAEYPAEKLYETIPNFHNTPSRFADFKKALAEDKAGRAKDVQAEIDFVLARECKADAITSKLESGEIPYRVTHNDTKLNNILIDDATGKAKCVIDLDTIMPGAAAYDFGDSIRFGASTGAEDETDLSKIEVDVHLFEVFAKGYLSTANKFLTPAEKDSLVTGAYLMTLECGVRFLTDHLNGDVYFKIHRENHNLDRCRTQFKLVADMEAKEAELREIVNSIKD
ncbi:MAG: aminoglycoside phosphotransferase family protein [Clostridia bacterium]|nr:aminoglycoside phosphotransferase family protein [Clostridia bacterium]